MLNKRDVRVLAEGLLVTFVGALVLYMLRRHVAAALLLGIIACAAVIATVTYLESRDADRRVAKTVHKKWIYGVLINVGDQNLKSLERSLQRASNGADEEAEQSVIHDANECYQWMTNALVEIDDVAGKPGTTAFSKHGLKRQRPSFLDSQLASTRWVETASRLDWLIDELGNL